MLVFQRYLLGFLEVALACRIAISCCGGAGLQPSHGVKMLQEVRLPPLGTSPARALQRRERCGDGCSREGSVGAEMFLAAHQTARSAHQNRNALRDRGFLPFPGAEESGLCSLAGAKYSLDEQIIPRSLGELNWASVEDRAPTPDLFCKAHPHRTCLFWREEADGLLHHASTPETEMLIAAMPGRCLEVLTGPMVGVTSPARSSLETQH